jgi:hypothetical protein
VKTSENNTVCPTEAKQPQGDDKLVNSPSNGAVDDPTFNEYMLKQLEVSIGYSQFLTELDEKANQYYVTWVSIIIGSATAIVTTQVNANLALILAISAVLIGSIGIRQRLRSVFFRQGNMVEAILRAGVHRYFQDKNESEFRRYGGEIILERHLLPHYQMRAGSHPWARIRAIGYFGLVHCALVGIGIGAMLQMPPIADLLPQPPSVRSSLVVPLCVAAVVLLTSIYWMSEKTKRSMTVTQQLCERLVAIQESQNRAS